MHAMETWLSDCHLCKMGLGWCSGSMSNLAESNPGSNPGSGRDAFAGVNMPLVSSGVSGGSLCHVQKSTVVKPDSPLD
jgi:hypothetical protein